MQIRGNNVYTRVRTDDGSTKKLLRLGIIGRGGGKAKAVTEKKLMLFSARIYDSSLRLFKSQW